MSLPYPLELAGLTDVGRARNNNEDAFAVDPDTALAVLADGMGGYNAGEVASQMLVGFLQSELGRWLREVKGHAPPEAVRRAIEICVDNANRAIFSAAHSNPRYSGMGTTLVMAVFRPEGLCVAHVGDSRLYRLRGDRIERVTKDHSLLQEQLDAGLITPEQAAVAAHKNLVTRAVGVAEQVQVDIAFHPIQPGDQYLLCSDGLSDMLDDERLLALCQRSPNLTEAARQLIAGANDQGGRDNITAVLARVGPPMRTESKSWWNLARR
ncbi:Stp1/IreP family PP2C-type Ser/Thr phosphatase [Inhella gelatinilytica]|uniref:Stp1/IreP family PP2C-type Ser/Thr phosphatase n=1 Tax=Inhella gelatinilytica TaxID=2795030 RepID=A0A931IUL7_9BURK|nr:Stp1/IreP family PP2C-type Ser/Thr phosphatase [Inhella gelatinilytica]MBH9551831.1 Stp1/IreP family PP2C-type Ser/Thr phosphatase [Inhella gelatinilytica]